MQELNDRIKSDGRNIGGGILKVDGFINHRIDSALMQRCGEELAKKFAGVRVDTVLTAEISGIAPALMTANLLGVPVVYARKKRPITMEGTKLYSAKTISRTKGTEEELSVSSDFLKAGEKILIIDDFLATGKTISALSRIILSSGATLVGVGTLVEKNFECGREVLSHIRVPIHSLSVINSMENGEITFLNG